MNLGPKLPDEGSPCKEQSQETHQGALFPFDFGLFETRALNFNLLLLACSHSSPFLGEWTREVPFQTHHSRPLSPVTRPSFSLCLLLLQMFRTSEARLSRRLLNSTVSLKSVLTSNLWTLGWRACSSSRSLRGLESIVCWRGCQW